MHGVDLDDGRLTPNGRCGYGVRLLLYKQRKYKTQTKLAEALETVIWHSPFGHRKDHAVSRFAIHTFESTPEAARQRVQSGDFSCVDTVEA